MRICQNIFKQINNTIRNCENMSGGGGGVCTFSDVLKFNRKYVKKFDLAWGGHLPPPKQNLKRRAWNEDNCINRFDDIEKQISDGFDKL